MADLKIYNNGENKILFSAGDRIIRQPYEFGKAFSSPNSQQYILIDSLSLELDNSSIIYWTDAVGLDTKEYVIMLATTEDRKWQQFQRSTDTLYVNPHALSFFHATNIAFNKSHSIFSSIDLSGLESIFANGSYRTNRPPSIVPTIQQQISNIYIGAGNSSHNTSEGSTMNSIRSTGKYSRFSLFSRVIDDSEYYFYYNNRIGSYFQTTEGIEIDLHNDKAEILNTGGSDFVGVRDYSGNNRHGEIMNLPAGTLQEQLDWANENLFVPFIS